jgi:hypothetical protein
LARDAIGKSSYLTELVEPCGALPRKCLFIYLFGEASLSGEEAIQVRAGNSTESEGRPNELRPRPLRSFLEQLREGGPTRERDRGVLKFEEIRDLRGDAHEFSEEERRETAELLWNCSKSNLNIPPVNRDYAPSEQWTAALIARVTLETEVWRKVTERRRGYVGRDMADLRLQWDLRRMRMMRTTRLVDQVRGWEQDELKKMGQKRLERLGSRGNLVYLKRKGTEQEVRDEFSGSDQAVEGDRDAELMNVDRNVQEDEVLLGTGERTVEFITRHNDVSSVQGA